MKSMKLSFAAILIFVVAGCATVTDRPVQVEAPVSRLEQQRAQKELSIPRIKAYKRKVAVGRFSNETRYGRTLWRDEDLDPLGKQASDMLMSRLIASGKFIVLERPDLSKIVREQAIVEDSDLVGSDTFIVGSVTEFGRFHAGQKGFLSKTKKQIARAKVEIRLVDIRSGHAFFSATGSGEANTESGEIAGFGSSADYDATLNDRAIAAAVSDVMNEIVSKLEERPWRTDILQIENNQVFISGGERQGIKIGDVLSVMLEGKKIKSQQTGFKITLPPKKLGELRVVSQFGDSVANEGSVCEIIDGSFIDTPREKMFVGERGHGKS
jgi:curli biogenesis system outer membrane secretion channel CsgG